MRILYVADKLEAAAGSGHKAIAITREWERRGHEVWLLTPRSTRPRRVESVVASHARPPQPRSFRERVRGELSFRYLHPTELAWHARRLEIDFIYARTVPLAPGLARLMGAFPVVTEINGDVTRELAPGRGLRSRIRSRGLQLERSAGVVFVSHELRRACAPAPRHSLVLGNPCLSLSEPDAESVRPERPTLVLIGYDRHDWAGMDKLERLARALPDLDFLLIGAIRRGPENLRSVGPTPQVEADRLMRGCTVGLGPLALHRKDMFEASPLKSRNYLSLGLPIVQAYEDTDLSADDGCVLQIPNAEDNVDRAADEIREFAWRAFRDPALSGQARALARGRLSLEAKEDERWRFLNLCLGR